MWVREGRLLEGYYTTECALDLISHPSHLWCMASSCNNNTLQFKTLLYSTLIVSTSCLCYAVADASSCNSIAEIVWKNTHFPTFWLSTLQHQWVLLHHVYSNVVASLMCILAFMLINGFLSSNSLILQCMTGPTVPDKSAVWSCS